MKLNSRIPSGPIEQKWDKHRFEMKLVNPANKRKFSVIVVGSGLAGASAAATMAELGYKVIGPVPGVAKAIEALDACAPDAAVLDVNVGGERVTPEILADFDSSQLICQHSRIATDRGVFVCPILIEAAGARLGDTLASADRPFALRYHACFTCYQYGSLCANPSSGKRDA